MTRFSHMASLVLLVSTVVFATIAPALDANGKQLTVAIAPEAFKSAGVSLGPGSKGRLIASLFDAAGTDPIWTEVTHDEITFPTDTKTPVVLVLGLKAPIANNQTNGNPIQLKDSPWLLLTLESDGKVYTSPRLQLNVVAYAHQATQAFEPAGDFKATMANYEMRIKTLETTVGEREQELAALREGFLKLRLQVNGTSTDEPVQD